MADPMVIHRFGDPAKEKAVKVTQGTMSWWVNPKTQVGLAVNVPIFNSNGRVVSFADGLVDARQTVFINDSRSGARPNVFLHRKSLTCITVHYYLYGRAWGNNQWEALVQQLHANILPDKRMTVFDYTASYYFNRPWEQEIRLQLPR